MRVTNLHDLPSPLVEAILADDYSRGEADISVTGLLTPPRITALSERYAEHLVEDASDRIWSLLGKSVHAMIDKTASYGVSEQRLYTKSQGWTVSGQFDHLSLREESGKAALWDWKVTSVWTLVYGDRTWEWEAQTNMYAGVLLHEAGYTVDEVNVLAILRDWQQSQSKGDGYPSQAVQRVPLNLWSPDEARRFMDKRVALHQKARTVLPQCSDEDRWAKPDKWAAYSYTKAGTRKARADRVYDNAGAAQDYVDDKLKGAGEVEHRKGDEWTRCRGYCPVSTFCDQYMTGVA